MRVRFKRADGKPVADNAFFLQHAVNLVQFLNVFNVQYGASDEVLMRVLIEIIGNTLPEHF